MSFELKTMSDTEGEDVEIITETITKDDITVKHWSQEQIQNEVIDLTEQIVDIESRITVLQEQLARFKK